MQRASLSLRSRWVLLSLCVSLPCLAAGCGASKGKVTGKVTMSNGEPLPGGTITFVPVSGKGNIASVFINPDGTYELDAPAGECKISIDNRNVGKKPAAPIGAGGGGNVAPPEAGGKSGVVTGPPGGKGGVVTGPPGGKGGPPAGKGGAPPKDDKDDIEKRMKETGQAKTGSGDVQPGTLKPINPKYYDPETSRLTYTVKGGTQPFDIKLDP